MQKLSGGSAPSENVRVEPRLVHLYDRRLFVWCSSRRDALGSDALTASRRGYARLRSPTKYSYTADKISVLLSVDCKINYHYHLRMMATTLQWSTAIVCDQCVIVVVAMTHDSYSMYSTPSTWLYWVCYEQTRVTPTAEATGMVAAPAHVWIQSEWRLD